MPFCGYCGKQLAYGEECTCRSISGNEENTEPVMHDYVCRYCGAEVKAGELCSCPKAQFEARFVRSRPRPQQYSGADTRSTPVTAERSSAAPPPAEQHTNALPKQFGDLRPMQRKKSKGSLITTLGVVTVLLISQFFSMTTRLRKNNSSEKTSRLSRSTAVQTVSPDPEEGSGGSGVITLPDSELPSSFSLADEGLLPDYVENQGEYGACFAFSWIGIFQNRLLSMGIKEDLSEWAFYKSFKEYYYNANRTNDIASMANLHTAIVPEDDAPYPADGKEYEVDKDIEKDSRYMVSDVYLLSGVGQNDREEVSRKAKEYLRSGYALICSVYYDDGEGKYTDSYKGTWYVYDDVHSKRIAINHSVLIVGWDDNYSRNNFLQPPPHDGAWLIRNSWGVYSGDYGYYWLSYDDEMFMYSELAAADIADADICDKVQSYWCYGWDYSYYNAHSNTAIQGKPMDKVYQACKYSADEEMDITAVSFFTVCDDISYRVYVVTEDDKYVYYDSPEAKGTEHTCGYHMVETPSHKHVKKGEDYTIIIIMESPEKDYLIVQDSDYAYDRPRAHSASAGTCYVSEDGEEWVDVKSYTLKNVDNETSIMPLCINAYGKT